MIALPADEAFNLASFLPQPKRRGQAGKRSIVHSDNGNGATGSAKRARGSRSAASNPRKHVKPVTDGVAFDKDKDEPLIETFSWPGIYISKLDEHLGQGRTLNYDGCHVATCSTIVLVSRKWGNRLYDLRLAAYSL